MTARGDDRKLMHRLAKNGYTVVLGASGHWKIREHDKLVTTASATPSDRNGHKNLLRDIQRYESNKELR